MASVNIIQEKMNKTNLNRDFLVLQALAIIMVVAGHCNNNFLNPGAMLPYYNFHMPLFVFISGYFFNNNKPIGDWMLHKIKKLIIPYYLINVVFALVSILLCYFWPFNLPNKITLKSILLLPLYPETLYGFNAATWFVIILFYIEFIYYICNKIFSSRKSNIIITLITIAIGLVAIQLSINNVYMNGDKVNSIIRSLLRTLTLLPFYGLGHIYRQYEEIMSQKFSERGGVLQLSNFKIFLLIVGILIITYHFYPDYYSYGIHANIDYKYCNFSHVIPTYIVAMCGIAFWLLVSKILSASIGKSKIIEAIGLNTFSIMSYHLFGFFCVNIIVILYKKIIINEEVDITLFMQNPRNSVYSNELSSWIYIIGSIVVSLTIKKIIDITQRKIISTIKQS